MYEYFLKESFKTLKKEIKKKKKLALWSQSFASQLVLTEQPDLKWAPKESRQRIFTYFKTSPEWDFKYVVNIAF